MKHASWAVAALTMVLVSTLQSNAGDQTCVRRPYTSATAYASWHHVLRPVSACLADKSHVSRRLDKPSQDYSAAPDCIAFELGDAKVVLVSK